MTNAPRLLFGMETNLKWGIGTGGYSLKNITGGIKKQDLNTRKILRNIFNQ